MLTPVVESSNIRPPKLTSGRPPSEVQSHGSVFQSFITGGIVVSKQSARGLVRARWVVLTLIAVATVIFAVGPAKSFIHHDDARTVSVARPMPQPAAVTPATRARVN